MNGKDKKSKSDLKPSDSVIGDYWKNIAKHLNATYMECKAVYNHYNRPRDRRNDVLLNFNPTLGIFPRSAPNSLIRLVLRSELRGEWYKFHPSIYSERVRPREYALMKLIDPERANKSYSESCDGVGVRNPATYNDMDSAERAAWLNYAWNNPDGAVNYLKTRQDTKPWNLLSQTELGQKRRNSSTENDDLCDTKKLKQEPQTEENPQEPDPLFDLKKKLVDKETENQQLKHQLNSFKIETSEPENLLDFSRLSGDAILNFYKNKYSEAARRIEIIKRKYQIEQETEKARWKIEIKKSEKKLLEEKQNLAEMKKEKSKIEQELQSLKNSRGESENSVQQLKKHCNEIEEKLENVTIRETMLQEELERMRKELIESRKLANHNEKLKQNADIIKLSEKKLEDIESRCKKLEAELAESRKTARSEIPTATLLQHKLERKKLIERNEALERELKKAQAELSMKKSELKSVKEEKDAAESKFGTIKMELTELIKRV